MSENPSVRRRSYRGVVSWSPGIVTTKWFVFGGVRATTVGVAPDRLVLGALDLDGILPAFLRPLRYRRVREATVSRESAWTTVSLVMRGRSRISVRVRHETAAALVHALDGQGITAKEAVK